MSWVSAVLGPANNSEPYFRLFLGRLTLPSHRLAWVMVLRLGRSIPLPCAPGAQSRVQGGPQGRSQHTPLSLVQVMGWKRVTFNPFIFKW